MNDIREDLARLDDIDSMARFLVMLGYERVAIKATLIEQFPGQDADTAIDAAEIHKAAYEADLDAAYAREGDAARAAEHDLSKTMHKET